MNHGEPQSPLLTAHRNRVVHHGCSMGHRIVPNSEVSILRTRGWISAYALALSALTRFHKHGDAQWNITIDQLALCLEFAFMVEVTSSDMSLLPGTPHTVSEKTRRANEFGSNEAPTPGRRGSCGDDRSGRREKCQWGRGSARGSFAENQGCFGEGRRTVIEDGEWW